MACSSFAIDWNAFVSIATLIMGVGVLGMAGEFAKGGLILGTAGLIAMASINCYTTLILSKAMLLCGPEIQTFGDLAKHALGQWGRVCTIILQSGICLLVPVSYLVLGGQLLLPNMFYESGLSVNIWIIVMGLLLLPIVNIATVRKALWVSLAGAICIGISCTIATVYYMVEETWNPAPTKIEFFNVVDMFGVMAFSYGAAVIVPALHRDHLCPEILPLSIVSGMVLVTVLYLAVGILGFAVFGCAAPSNFLLGMVGHNNATTIICFTLMFIGLTASYAVVVNPTLWNLERKLGILDSRGDSEKASFEREQTGSLTFVDRSPAYLSKTTDKLENQSPGMISLENFPDDEQTLYCDCRITTWWRNLKAGFRPLSFALRSTILAMQCFVACLLQNAFIDVIGFIGSFLSAGGCVVMPSIIYYAMCKHKISVVEKTLLLIGIVVICLLAGYNMYSSGKGIVDSISSYNLFSEADTTDTETTNYCKSSDK